MILLNFNRGMLWSLNDTCFRWFSCGVTTYVITHSCGRVSSLSEKLSPLLHRVWSSDWMVWDSVVFAFFLPKWGGCCGSFKLFFIYLFFFFFFLFV